MQIQTFTKAGIAVLFSFLISLPVAAQDSGVEIDTANIYTLDEVIISASRWEQQPQTVGRNVTVISREEINRSLHSSVGDLLAEHQSMHIVGNGQTDGAVQSLFMRHADGNNSVIMIDGVRISDPSTPGNSIDLAELSLAGVERIEIVRGSHSTLYGSSAIGGVVNIITREGSGTGVSGAVETNHSTFGNSSYSMNNTVSANYSHSSGLYLDLGVVQEMTQGLDATVDTVSNPNVFNPQDRDDFNKLDLNGKVGYQTSRLDFYGSYRRVDQENDSDQSAYVDDDNARSEFQRDLYSYGVSYSVSDNVEFNFSGAYSDLNRHFENDSSVVDVAGNYDGTYTETRGEGTIWENELTGRIQSDGFSAILGLGNSRQTMSTYSYTYSSAFDFESESNLDSLDLQETINHAFAYTELNGSLIDGNWDSFTLGLGTRLSGHNEFGTHFTYEINPKIQIGSKAVVYGAVSTGFNAPSLYQMYSPAEGFGAHTNRGNSSLEPETSLSMEAGWKQNIGDRLRIEVSLFWTRVENAIEYIYLWNGSTPTGSLSGSDYRGDTYINLAEQQTNGIEFGLQTQPMPGVNISGNVTYATSTLDFSPGDIDESYTGGHHVQIYEGGQFVNEEKEVDGLVRRPEVTANADLSYRATDRLNMGMSTRFVGKNDDIYYSASLGPYGAVDRAEVDRYNITDLYASYRITSSLSVKVKVNNLFNTEYTEINGYNTRGRGIQGRVRFTF